MKVPGFIPLVTLAAASFFGTVLGWSEVDHEIFRIRNEIEKTEGPGVTFYDFIGTKPSANLDEINKAARKASIRMHPDKFKPKSTTGKLTYGQIEAQKKKANERYARLKVVIEILRGPARDRYDHFLKNGFPIWKGSGYYYARYRPGFGSVLIALFVVGGGAFHYGILVLKARQQRKFMQSYINEARTAAWGSAGIPGLDNKRSVSGRRKVMTENGKMFMVDSTGDVFLVEEDEFGNAVEYPLDLNEIEGAKWSNTALFLLPGWFYRITVGRFIKGKTAEDVEEEEEEAEDDSASDAAANGKKKAAKKGVAKKVERDGNLPRRRVKAKKPAKE